MSVTFSVQEIRDNILFGVPLFDTSGNPFPDDLLQAYLDSAVAWAEQTLNIAIQPRAEEEYHDYFASDYLNWNFIKLWKKPILQVESIEMVYGDRKVMHIPKDWLKVDHLAGHMQIFPVSGSSGGLIINAAGGVWQPLIHGQLGYAPQMWKVNYTAGMTDPNPSEQQVYRKNTLHPNLKQVIYMKASQGIMNVYGDLVIGTGIASQSIGIDGLSQSIGTTQSAMYGASGSRIAEFQDAIEQFLPGLRSYYGGIDMVVI